MSKTKIFPTKKIGEIVEDLKTQKAPLSSWPYIEIGDINIENKTVIFKDKKSIEGAVIAPKDSILVSRVRPTRGAIVLLDKDYAVSPAFTILKAKISETSSKFLFYRISHSRDFLNYLQKKQKGSNYPSVREKDILNFKISLPPIFIQQKIVERLDVIRKAQELNNKQIALADQLFQSLLHRELNPKGKNWEVKKMGELCDIYQPKTITSAEILKEGPYKVYGANGVIGYYNKYNHEDSEVLVTCRGATCGTINLSEPKCWITGNAMVVHPKTPSLSKVFLYYVLKASDLSTTITGAAQPQITRTSLSPFKILLPPMETQREIVEKLSAVEEYKKKLIEQKEKLQEFFDSVLNKSFEGQL